jgi:membrane dipeptidase
VIARDLLDRARELHRTHPVVEGHSDIAVDIRRRRVAGERSPLRDDYLKRLRQGGVRFQMLMVGGDVPMGGDAKATLRALEMIDDILSELADCTECRLVDDAADLDEAIAEDQLGLVLHFEGCRPLEPVRAGQDSPLADFVKLGLRSVQLTWNGGNRFADGVGVESPGGLSEEGRALVADLQQHGILIDVSHLAERGFWELAEIVRGPFIASHANAHALCPHRRNLKDDQIRAIAESGGLVGVCFVSDFIGEEATLDLLLDHVDHIVGLAGIDAVGVGPDYVDFAPDLMPRLEFPEGLRRVETLPVFTAGLLGRGYSEDDAAKILGGNSIRVLRAVLPSSS